MSFFWWKEKRLKTVWRVEREGKASLLVGTAHFTRYRFKKALTKLIQKADTILFEGPLDQESMARVVQYGRQAENIPSVYEALDPQAVKELNNQLSTRLNPPTTPGTYLELIHSKASNYLESYTVGVRPWMAFLTVWSALLDWKYSMDTEAFHIAQARGKKIRFLETIEDQLAALDGIPFDRIVNYLNHVPTRCESIIQKRDPIFFNGMKPFFVEGKAAAFVGVGHIPGIQKLFLDEGYQIVQEEA